MLGSLARVQPNKVKLSENGPHVRAMDLGPQSMRSIHPHKCHLCGWIERIPGGTRQELCQGEGDVDARSAGGDCQGGRGDCEGEGDDARSEALGGDAANVVEQARLGCAVTRRKGSSSCGTVHVQSSSQYARTHAYFTTKTWPRQNLPLVRRTLFIVIARDYLLKFNY